VNQRDLNASLNLIPTKEQITKTYLEQQEKVIVYEKQKLKIIQRAKKARQTIHAQATKRQTKQTRRATNKSKQAVNNPVSLSTHDSSDLRLETESVAPIPEETLNQTWSFGKSESVSAERNLIVRLEESLTDQMSEGQIFNPEESPPLEVLSIGSRGK
jgi:hypothetical protein